MELLYIILFVFGMSFIIFELVGIRKALFDIQQLLDPEDDEYFTAIFDQEDTDGGQDDIK